MARYPQQSFDAMRQDAIRRSREMQRRAVPQMPPESVQPPAHPPGRNYQETGSGSGIRPNSGLQLPFPEDLRKILTEWDGEKLALLALLYLLYKEGADLELLIAIAYIML
ncbi:MAG: hypothetical protein K2H29_08240 [Oscillospiraceae bacterium]|nr:hypothetical protein [Oscillospiraceae bacterium]MDE5885043.1 hypothetical protein [Oscillospiraceae bacterium]